MKYIFEYNEKEGNFHQNFGTCKPGTMGYRVICECETYIWDPFSHWIRRRYQIDRDKCPTFDLILKEWNEYLVLRKEIEEYNKRQ